MSAASRAQVLEAIRQALAPLPQSGTAQADRPVIQLPTPLPARGAESTALLVARFVRAAEGAGAQVARVASHTAAGAQIRSWLAAHGARQVVCAPTKLLAGLGRAELSRPKATVHFLDPATSVEERRQRLLAADVGISDADYGLADTGTLVVRGTPAQGRLVSLVPPVHIGLLSRGRIVADLAACFRALNPHVETQRTSLLTLITGPSRTADIEQTLTLEVHGPGTLYILLMD
ncbi:MAG: lactate utilization protein C [Terriglobia bacterium]